MAPSYEVLLQPVDPKERSAAIWYYVEAESEAEAADLAMERTGMNAVTWREFGEGR